MQEEGTKNGLDRIAGYLLNGGKSRRMNGENKLFLQYKGVCFYSYIRKALCAFPVVYLSVAEENQVLYQELSLPMVIDKYPGLGPMGGIYSGLLECPEKALFVAACDVPLIEKETVSRVTEEYGKTGRLTVVKTGERIHPLFGIYPKSVLPVMEKMIAQGNYRMRDLLVQAEADVLVLEPENRVGINVNTQEDYRRLCEWNKIPEFNRSRKSPASIANDKNGGRSE